MAGHRVIKSVLHNFLGTYTSRYSDFRGYYLFGFLIEDIDELRIDLIKEISGCNETTPLTFVRRLAVIKFAEQTEKAGLPKSYIRESTLDIRKSPELISGYVNGWLTPGYNVTFVAKTTTDIGKVYERTISIFIAPHNPKVELQSTRDWKY
jgi:hypothetical protein